LSLYRELVDATTPWIAQQTGDSFRPGIIFTMSLATFGWLGVRGMTWFLFARYGTPTLLAIISATGVKEPSGGARPSQEAVSSWTKEMISQVKADIGWFQTTGTQLLEAYILPPLQIVAGTINFFMLLIAGRHLFQLPLKSLDALMETGELLKLVRAGGHASSGAKGR